MTTATSLLNWESENKVLKTKLKSKILLEIAFQNGTVYSIFKEGKVVLASVEFDNMEVLPFGRVVRTTKEGKELCQKFADNIAFLTKYEEATCQS